MRKIDIIAGARPNFMKIAPIIHALEANRTKGSDLIYRLIHTGQHYDKNMSESFFEQLGIPDPDFNLCIGSGTQAEQTAGIMTGYEKLLLRERTSLCLVVGDVTSTMACAITAQKMQVPVAHVEGGIRSGDWSMPEEINRMVTDSISNWFFTTGDTANSYLKKAGVSDDRIFFVGNTMIDSLLKNVSNFKKPFIWDHVSLEEKKYFVITLHRPNNVDGETRLKYLLETIIDNSRGLPIIFPVHPRTAKNLRGMGLESANLFLTEPLGYLEFNYLVKHAFAVITDSGGITEETTVMGVPCMTARDNTERPETITIGTNELIGTDPSRFAPFFSRLFAGEWKKGAIPPLWDGKTASRIVECLEKLI